MQNSFIRVSILLLTCIAMFQNAWSQENEEDLVKRNFNFSEGRIIFQMNGPNDWNAQLNYVKPLKKNLAVRLGISPIINFNKSKGDPGNLSDYRNYTDERKYKKYGVDFSLGAEYHIKAKGKIDPYVLFGMGLGVLAEKNIRTLSYEYAVALPSTQISYNRNEENVSAPQFNFKPFTGFGVNYYFHPQFAFGIEYSFGPGMVLVKGEGKSSYEEISTYTDGTEVQTTTEFNSQLNSFWLNFEQQIGFHMIYVLSPKNKN